VAPKPPNNSLELGALGAGRSPKPHLGSGRLRASKHV